jgi:hypothetical protein
VEVDLQLSIENAPYMHLCFPEEPDHADAPDLKHEWARSIYCELTEITNHYSPKTWEITSPLHII